MQYISMYHIENPPDASSFSRAMNVLQHKMVWPSVVGGESMFPMATPNCAVSLRSKLCAFPRGGLKKAAVCVFLFSESAPSSVVPQLFGKRELGVQVGAENTMQHPNPDNNQEFRSAVIADQFFLISNRFSSSQFKVSDPCLV